MKNSILVFTLMAAPCFAGIAFQNATLSGTPGALLSFQGSITNTWGVETWLNSVSQTLDGFAPEDVDLMPFLINAPLSLPPGDTAGPFEWFTVLIPAALTPGLYHGEFVLLGGLTPDDQNILDTAPFEIQIDASQNGIPEPGTLLLLGPALLCLLGASRRR